MHYCTLLITKELPTEDKIYELLEPYNSEDFYNKLEENPNLPYPIFTWDYFKIGGRYSAMIKLDTTNNDTKYEWEYVKERNNKLFISSLLNKLEKHIKPKFLYHENDYYAELGYRDGFIRVDGAEISDIINLEDIGGYNILVEDEECITREYYDGDKFIENKNFDKQEKEIFKKNKNSFLTILDIHD